MTESRSRLEPCGRDVGSPHASATDRASGNRDSQRSDVDGSSSPRSRRSRSTSLRTSVVETVRVAETPPQSPSRARRTGGQTRTSPGRGCLGAQLAISVNNCPPPRDPRSRMTSFKRTQRKYVQKAYRVRNWREYETGLRARGSLTVWLGLTDGKLANWNSPRPTRRKPGRQRKYSNHAIETTVTLGLVFALASRQTEGFLRSLLTLLNLDNDVPDHFSHRLTQVLGAGTITRLGRTTGFTHRLREVTPPPDGHRPPDQPVVPQHADARRHLACLQCPHGPIGALQALSQPTREARLPHVHVAPLRPAAALVHNSRSRSIIALHPEIRGPA